MFVMIEVRPFGQNLNLDHFSIQMKTAETLHESRLSDLTLIARGKVRDIYEIDPSMMMIVTTDRISAFDCILPDPIPGKGQVLTEVANFWFDRLSHIVPNHLTGIAVEKVVSDPQEQRQLVGRTIIVKRLKALPVEAVVRGYLIGSGWKDYQKTGCVCGVRLPTGLQLAEKLPEAIFTPSTKAEFGQHDENIDFQTTIELLGESLANQVKDVSIKLYQEAAAYALSKGIIIADTKFEFGVDDQGVLHLIDEVLTPDSSRFWPLEHYQVGVSPPSFDKQFVRDYLETLTWNKQPPAPHLPADVIKKTAEKYREAKDKLIGV
jgi:phosphoribosylaminoimidazole-succinocarboxamide synthase